VIPNLAELGEKLGLAGVLIPLVLAALLTVLVFLVPSVAQWFDERNP
jgi:hypothetical protein